MKNQLKILCNYNLTAKYKRKPTSEQVRLIQSELTRPAEIEVEVLANSLVNGCNCRASAVNGRNDCDFVSQQLFLFDFDNTDRKKKPFPPYKQIRPEQAIETAKKNGLKPCFAYYTHSHTEEIPKFRLAFLTDKPIIDDSDRKSIFDVVFGCFGSLVDTSCRNKARIFYGSNAETLIYADFKAVNSLNDILSIAKSKAPKTANMKAKQNTSGSRASRPKTPLVTASGGNIEAIKNHDIEYLKSRIGNPKKIVFDTRKEFFDYLYKEIDLAELLEVEPKKNFCCILPEHKDSNPSANVFKEKFGNWKYKCFGCDTTMNTKQIVELLGNFDSEYKALEFIKAIYNIEIKVTEWSQEQTENIDRILNCISGCDEESFSVLCPTANSTTRNAQAIFIQILILAKNTIYPERTADNGNIIFYMSIRQLAKASGKSSIDKVSKYLKMLIYHKMLEIVPDEEIPQQFLNKAIKQRGSDKHRHTNFYSIPSWVIKRIQLIESQGQKWKENNYRLNGISYEMFYRAEGQKVASELFPQYSKIHTSTGKVIERTTTKKSDQLHEEIQSIILGLITEKGYCTEAEVIVEAGRSKKTTDIQIKRSLADIMACNCLKKSRATNELKARFGIKADRYSHPMIIYPEE